jgi:hypothetical protein
VNEKQFDPSWTLKLRYGRLKTPYTHYTAIAEGVVGDLADGFSCGPGAAFMGMKLWATSEDEAFDMVVSIGQQISFTVDGQVQLFASEPADPPDQEPYGYDINFTPFRPEGP